MDRTAELLKYVDGSQLGIEVGPYHNPTAPKNAGFNCISIDVFDADELRRKAVDDPNLGDAAVAAIEPVDIVGSAVDLADLVRAKYGDRKFSYIVSSHNFEHLPDPIRFLRGCSEVLSADGVLSMAVPDRRFCFDYFRPSTELSEWLEAFHEQRRQPTPAQVFRFEHLKSSIAGVGAWQPGEPRLPQLDGRLDAAFETWTATVGTAVDERPYVDTHCSTFTPAALKLLLADLRHLGLIDLVPVRVTGTYGCEFFVHLRKDSGPAPDAASYHEIRTALLREAADEHTDSKIPPASLRRIAIARTTLRNSVVAAARRRRATNAALETVKDVRDRIRGRIGAD